MLLHGNLQDESWGERLIYSLYEDVSLKRVSFSGFRIRDRVSLL